MLNIFQTVNSIEFCFVVVVVVVIVVVSVVVVVVVFVVFILKKYTENNSLKVKLSFRNTIRDCLNLTSI